MWKEKRSIVFVKSVPRHLPKRWYHNMAVINLRKTYQDVILPELKKELGDLNIFSVPRLTKIVVNAGIGKMVNFRRLRTTVQKSDEEMVADLIHEIALITGQRPQVIRARRSIASFKLREGMIAGLKATLHGPRMYDFLARFIHVVLPRTRDFRGIPLKNVDQNGNLTIGIKESSIFPELASSNIIWSFEVTLVTSTNERDQAIALFRKLGIPLQAQT